MGRKGTPAATRAVVADRRRQAIDLRHAGYDALTIGLQLRYGKWTLTPGGDPADRAAWVQVSSDKTIARMVRQDITRGLEDRRAGLDESIETMRREQTERLERLRAGLWGKAAQGNLGAVREAVGIERQISHLWGLNTPVKQHVEVGAASAEVEAAVVELVRLIHTTAEGAPQAERLEA